MKKKAIIIGAGPAGLTAAYELLKHTDIIPIIYEKENFVGGISRTCDFDRNKMDMGGHRFFSKNDRVMDWWKNILPIQGSPSLDDLLLNKEIPLSKEENAPNPESSDRVMLVRNRISRIFYLKSFFDYPVSLNFQTISNLGFLRMLKIGLSYIKAMIFPIKNEKTLEDFMINRFGKELYLTFFKDYTEKVWGVSCKEIPADWGTQRIKGISVIKVLKDAFSKIFKENNTSIDQKNKETSLIEQFLYPKFGPGHLWEQVAEDIKAMGGEIYLNSEIKNIEFNDNKIIAIWVNEAKIVGEYFFSTMPIKDLINSFINEIPQNVKEVANGLIYRDFRTVGLLVNKLKIKNNTKIKTLNNIVPDTWIYIQEREVKLGRLQVFNNWSPYLVKQPKDTVWLGLEYFCNKGDSIWQAEDETFIDFAINELEQIGIIDKKDVLKGCSVKVGKAYPAYFGTYNRLFEIINFVNTFDNLFLLGRNGTHRYNNMDHSMLTAMYAVDNIINNTKTKDNIWNVNAEETYHEVKKELIK